MTDKINIEDLPPELVKELALTRRDLTLKILNLLKDGPLDTNHILIGLYKIDGTIFSRVKISNMLSTLRYQGRIFTVPGKRGFYSLESVKND